MSRPAKTLRLVVTGRVQGVSFRYWTQDEATALGLSGWVRNRWDGSVEAVISGPPQAVDAMLVRCKEGPRAARVDEVLVKETDENAPSPFEIRPTV